MYTTTENLKGWFEHAKGKVEEVAKSFDMSAAHFTQLGVAAGVGFVSGFFLKKFGRPVILLFIFMILGLLVLQYADVVIVDWAKIKNIIGIAPAENITAFAESWYAWAKEHISIVVSGGIGFLIGYKVG